jgi:hypothetical protein
LPADRAIPLRFDFGPWLLEAAKLSESKKNLQIQKTYEALFALEDLREIFRQSLPAGFDEKQQEEFSNAVTRIKSIISD